jgi:hypothetical protein
MPDWPKHKAVGDDEANGFAFVPNPMPCIPARHQRVVELANNQ